MTEASSPPGKTTQEAGPQGTKQPSYLNELPDEQKIFVGNLAPDLEDRIFFGWMTHENPPGWWACLFKGLVSWIFASSAEWEGFLYTRVKLMVDTVYSYAAEWSP